MLDDHGGGPGEESRELTINEAGLVDASTLAIVGRLKRDLKQAAKVLGRDEARFLLDAYYTMQNDRIRDDHQKRTLEKGGEPAGVLSWLGAQHALLENEIRLALGAYARAQPAGEWATSVKGVGPVMAAGLLCHIDPTKAHDSRQVWSFAGLNPEKRWEKGQKRPWNAALKRLCWLLGESLTKVGNYEDTPYSQLYKARKMVETRRNERGEYAHQAKASLEAKKFGADTQARAHYEAGRLPPARIHLRAQRYAVKILLDHYFTVAYFVEHGKLPTLPFILNDPAHSHRMLLWNMGLIPGLEEAYLEGSKGLTLTSIEDYASRMIRFD